jgi:hypothetical protein
MPCAYARGYKDFSTTFVDSEKLAKALKAGTLKSIYIRRKDNLDNRGVVRLHKTLQKQLGGYKSRVKHLLYNNGVFPSLKFYKLLHIFILTLLLPSRSIHQLKDQ